MIIIIIIAFILCWLWIEITLFVSNKKYVSRINKKQFTIKKLSTENNELYGSVKPTEISRIILENENLEIKPSMMQLSKEIKSLGDFKVKIDLHSQVQAVIDIKVIAEEITQ